MQLLLCNVNKDYFGYSLENTRKTWNTDFVIVCQNLISPVFLNLKPISYFFGVYMAWFFI